LQVCAGRHCNTTSVVTRGWCIGALTHELIQTAIGHGYGKSDYVILYEVAARAAALPTENHEP